MTSLRVGIDVGGPVGFADGGRVVEDGAPVKWRGVPHR